MAEATLYKGDPRLPSQTRQAFLHLISTVPGSFSDDSKASELRDGALACTSLGRQEGASQIVGKLAARHLTDFESYVVTEFGAQYLCPKELTQESSDMQQALLDGP